MADQISDAILDEMLAQDPMSRVACETLVTTGLAVVAGEITTEAYVDIPGTVRRTINEIGYNNEAFGYDGNTCGVMVTSMSSRPTSLRASRPRKRSDRVSPRRTSSTRRAQATRA